MRWRKPHRRQPQAGDTRQVRRFAWLPKRCEDEVVVWLVPYVSHQEFSVGASYDGWWASWVERRAESITPEEGSRYG